MEQFLSLPQLDYSVISDINDVALKIHDQINQTPFQRSEYFSKLFGMEVFLKKENLQVAGSFKSRGALAALISLSENEKQHGVIAASTGNHALALSYHSMNVGIPVTVVALTSISITKRFPAEVYGADVIIHGKDFDEAQKFAFKLSYEQDMPYIDSDDNLNVIFGQGTIGLEILDELPNVDAILVPARGGIITGITLAVKALKPDVEIIGVMLNEAQLHDQWKKNNQEHVESAFDFPKGLMTLHVKGSIGYGMVKDKIDRIIQVDEKEIAEAMLLLYEKEKVAVECPAALGIAAALSGKLSHLRGKRVVSILTGGNIDKRSFSKVIDSALFKNGRLAKITVTLPNREGGINDFITALSSINVIIRRLEDKPSGSPYNMHAIRLCLEVLLDGYEHCLELTSFLEQRYKQFEIQMADNYSY